MIPGFSPRKARELRAREVITGGGSGGRGKATPYTDEDVMVAAEVERAKSDEAYSSKLERAILIAYARRAPVRTEGLKRAWADEFKRSPVAPSRVLGGGRIRDASWDGVPAQERDAAIHLMARILMGEDPSPELVRDALAARLPGVVAEYNQLIEALVENATPDELESVDPRALGKEDRAYAGLLQENANDSWSPDGRRNSHLTPMPGAFRLVESFSLAAQIDAAKRADREELDEARMVLLYLRHLGTSMPTDMFQMSDFELAMFVPHWVVTERAREGRSFANPTRRRKG